MNYVKYFILALFILNKIDVIAQNDIDYTIYNSTFEKEAFVKYITKKPVDVIDFFISIQYEPFGNYSKERILNKIDEFYQLIEEKKTSKMSIKKITTYLFDQTHYQFLHKYKESAYFHEIFSNGNYNCVTATALLSLFLKKYQIPFQIKEQPTHVYLIADPQGEKIMLETTIPSIGVIKLSTEQETKYIDFLYNHNFITKDEYERKGSQIKSQQLFFNDSTIDIYQLAGIQYLNLGIEYSNKMDYTNSVKAFEKAYILFPCQKNLYFLLANLLEVLDKEINNNVFNSITISKYATYSIGFKEKISLSHIIGNASNYFLFANDSIEKFNYFFHQIMNSIQDDELKNKIKTNFHSELAKYYKFKNMPDSALNHLFILYNLFPDDGSVQEHISSIVQRSISELASWNDKIAKFEFYNHQYSIFKKVPVLQSNYLITLMYLVSDLYQKNSPEAAETYLQKFESNPVFTKGLMASSKLSAAWYPHERMIRSFGKRSIISLLFTAISPHIIIRFP